MKSFIYLNLILFGVIAFSSLKYCSADGAKVKKSVEENDDNGETNEESKDESLDIPVESNEQQPGVVAPNVTCTRRANSHMHEIRDAVHKQFPFVVSIMSQGNDHLCTGTVVSNGLILTSAQCTQLPISYVLMNATKAKKDETTVALHVIKIEKFPTFATPGSDKDVGLIYTKKHNNTIAAKIRLSNFTSSTNIVDLEVLGFGLNSELGQPRVLQYVGAENRLTPKHPTDFKDELSAYFDCIDTTILTCFKDMGGPSIYADELVGIVTKGDHKCFKEITSSYSINKKLAEILPTYTFRAWLEEKIKKNEENDLVALVTFPNKPVPARRSMSSLADTKNRQLNQLAHRSAASCHQVMEILFLVIFLLLC